MFDSQRLAGLAIDLSEGSGCPIFLQPYLGEVQSRGSVIF